MLGTNIGKTYKKDYRFSYRHDSIRQFQRAEKVPKVFVLTMKAGSCGITLTAATRVYLMEPCLDPAHEIQAAGKVGKAGPTGSKPSLALHAYCMEAHTL